MKLLLVINPISGGTDKTGFLKFAGEHCRMSDTELEIFKTSGNNDLERLKQQITKAPPDRIACAGGDGTFSLVVKATLGNVIPMGFVPMGSANGFAKELNVSNNPETALDDLLQSKLIVPMDLLVVNEQHLCLHMGDVGVNAQIVAAFEADENRGLSTYGKHLLTALSDVEDFEYHFNTGDQKKSGRAVMIGIGNGSRYGTGVPLNTVGNPLDGKFEITVIEEMDADTVIRAGLSVINESFLEGARMKVYPATEVEIKLSPEQLLQLDGEVIGHTGILNVRIEPGAIPLITTSENPYLNPSKISARANL